MDHTLVCIPFKWDRNVDAQSPLPSENLLLVKSTSRKRTAKAPKISLVLFIALFYSIDNQLLQKLCSELGINLLTKRFGNHATTLYRCPFAIIDRDKSIIWALWKVVQCFLLDDDCLYIYMPWISIELIGDFFANFISLSSSYQSSRASDFEFCKMVGCSKWDLEYVRRQPKLCLQI